MKKGSSGRITIRDIAEEVGVSPTAVSFYLNGKASKFNLSKDTCKRIQEVLDIHDYRPNFHARALNKRHSYLIGVIIHQLELSFFPRLIAGVEQELAKHDFHLLLAESKFSHENELKAIKNLMRVGVDGFIIAPAFEEGAEPVSYGSDVLGGKPACYLLYGSDISPLIRTNHDFGVRMVCDALWAKGHRRIAYYGYGLYERTDYFMNLRFTVFQDELVRRGGSTQAYSDIELLCREIGNYTAVFCFSDDFAVNLIWKLQDMGLRVPEDISVVGYGGDSAIEQYFRPKITTVCECKEEIGTLAAQNILKKIEDPSFELPPLSELQPEFIPGETLGAVR